MSYVGDTVTHAPAVNWVQFSDGEDNITASVETSIKILEFNPGSYGYSGSIGHADQWAALAQASVGAGYGSTGAVAVLAFTAAGLIFTVTSEEANIVGHLTSDKLQIKVNATGTDYVAGAIRAAIFQQDYNWSTVSNQSARDLIDNASIQLTSWESPMRFSTNATRIDPVFAYTTTRGFPPISGTLQNGAYSMWSLAYYPIIESSSDTGSLASVRYTIAPEETPTFLLYDWKHSTP